MLQYEIVMRRVFAAVNDYDTPSVLRDWNPDGIYDNLSVGVAARRHDEVFARIDKFVQSVKQRSEKIASNTSASILWDWVHMGQNGK